ncbi:MAG: cation-transporting P-type ATPase [Verrucomicrobia bacterium]|nr:cation-transporting P-type ATPase [Verrucomicrobiota bacterium]
MKIHHLTVSDAFASLQSRGEGLYAKEAARRLAEFGPNIVERVRGEPLALRFLKDFTHFFAIILWVAAGLAFLADWWGPGHGMATLGFAMIGVIAVNGVFSFWQEFRAEKAIHSLQRLLPREATVLRESQAEKIPAAELVPGDIVLLEEGANVPADCRLLEGFDVRVNNATVTGESLPHARDSGPSSEPELLHSANVLLAGTWLVSGQAKALVFATGAHSEFGKIARLTQSAKEPMSPLQKEIVRLSHLVAVLALGLGVIFFFIGRAIGLSFWANFIFAIGIIVANVPEGLLPTVTLALAMGSQRMARRHALIRHLPAVETLGSTTVICTDKTGTLTQNEMAVTRLYLDGQVVDPREIAQSGSFVTTHRRFFETAWFCHNVKPGKRAGYGQWFGDPMEIAIVQMAANVGLDNPEFPRLDEIPFDSQRRRLATVQQTPEGAVLYLKGAPEVVLPRCELAELDGALMPLTDALRARFRAAEEAMAAAGLRVLAFAHRPVPTRCEREHLEERLTLTGLVGLEDPPRPEVTAAIAQCRAAGIKVIMVTGDHPQTALAIGREIDLVRSNAPVVITGEQLHRLSNTQLQLALDAPEILFARVAADQKMRIVAALKRKREIVAVTGDGVNDAPALKQADIGIAMGLSGTDVAREAADMVLLDDNFASIVAAIEEGRAVFANIRKFLTYILTSNVPELMPYLAFVLFKIPLPLTVIQILAVDLGTDMVPALGLGAEKPGPNVMRLPPRPRAERLLDWALIARAYLWLGPMQAAAALAAFFFVLRQGGWRYGETLPANAPLYLQATTACLTAIIIMQVANVFLCRSRRESVFRFGLFSNPLIWLGLGVELSLILAIDYTSWGNAVFGTAPIPIKAWLFVLPFALGMLALEELRKWIVRTRSSASCVGPSSLNYRRNLKSRHRTTTSTTSTELKPTEKNA